jgi:hypothetical protein
MSDNFLRYVPTNPEFRPTERGADLGKTLLASLFPGAESVSATFEDGVRFFDPGGNLQTISCAHCGANCLPWWGDAMERAAETRFSNLVVTSGCCDVAVNLNDLLYDWPAAFGRFSLEVSNAGSPGIPNAQLENLEIAVGTRMREIAVHV